MLCAKNFRSHLPGPASFNVHVHSNTAAILVHTIGLRDLVSDLNIYIILRVSARRRRRV
jgi:hypothetical protein